MHEMVQRRAAAEEKKIVAEVRSHMPPEEIRRVDADAKKYFEGVEKLTLSTTLTARVKDSRDHHHQAKNLLNTGVTSRKQRMSTPTTKR